MTDYRERPVLITGCSSGIGYAVARGLKSRGYRVFATARKAQDVERLVEEGFETALLDLDNPTSISAAVEEVLQLTGDRLYALFNNGAFGQPGAVEDLKTEVLRAQFESNLFGWHELTLKVLPAMRRQGEGRIIQNSSILGLVALRYRGAYIASKYALEGLSDTLRLELHGTGIHVSLIEPRPIETRFRANALAKWKAHIDREHSIHQEAYRRMEERLAKQGPVAPFTLPPEAVMRSVIHALESRHPRARYYVTVPTYLLGTLKRLLPVRAMDWVLPRI